MPLAYLGAVVATAGIVIGAYLFLNRAAIPGWVNGIYLTVVLVVLMGALMVRYSYWHAVVDAVEVTEEQYPELYAIFVEQLHRGAFDYLPRLYLINGNGGLNAFASKSSLDVTKGGYVVISSDLLDTFYDLGNVETVRFVLSHELGHLKLGHVHMRRLLLQEALKPLFLGPTLSRAQEYSADRFGAAIAGPNAMRSLAVLYAGKRNYESANLDAYVDNDARHISRFWVAVVSFFSSHPVGRRRMATARRMDHEGWERVHGKMF